MQNHALRSRGACASRELVHAWLPSITDALLSKSDALPVRYSPWPDCLPPSLVDRHPLYPSVCPISASPSHCRHVAEHPGALLTRFFRLSGADCCAAISPRAATSTPEQLKPRRRGVEAL